MTKAEPARLSYKDFTLRAIKALAPKPGGGIHLPYSGFNGAFEAYFGEPARPHIDQLVKEGVVSTRPAKGGVVLNIVDKDHPATLDNSQTLAKILGK